MGEKGTVCGIETSAMIDDISPHSTVSMFNLNKSEAKDKDAKDNIKISI